MAYVPFKIGYCPIDGKQSQVTDTRNGVISGLLGSKVCWVTLTDDPAGVDIKSRIGTFALCSSCDPLLVDPQDVINSFINSTYSGVTEESLEPELSMFPVRGIEVVKTYGE